MHAQARRSGAEMIDDDIVPADVTTDIETVSDTTGTVHHARSVIVPTGSGHRKLDIPKEDELSDRGVSWCATRDGFFFHDRDIVVVGGDDTAMEEATFLTRFVRSITVVRRRSSLWAYQVMQNPAFSDEKIFFAFDTGIAQLKEEDGKLSGLVLHDVFTGKNRDPDVTGLSSPSATIPAANYSKGRPALDHHGCTKAGRGPRGGCVDRRPPLLGGLDEFEDHGQDGGAGAGDAGDLGPQPHATSRRRALANVLIAASAWSRSSALQMSWMAFFAPGRADFGMEPRTMAVLRTQHLCSRVAGNTWDRAFQRPRAPSPTARTGARTPRRARSCIRSAQDAADSR